MSSFGPEDGPQSLDLVCNMLPARQDHQLFACKALSDQLQEQCALKLLDLWSSSFCKLCVGSNHLLKDHACVKSSSTKQVGTLKLMLWLASLYSKIMLPKLIGVSCASFLGGSKEAKAESSQKKHSCCISEPPIKMQV